MTKTDLANTTTEETIGIDASGNDVQILLAGRTVVSLDIAGDGAASYQIDGRASGGAWKKDVGPKTYSGSSDYSDVLNTGVEEMRIRCSNGTGGTDDEATILISAGGR